MALLTVGGGGGGKGLEIDDETTPVEIDVVIAGDGDFLIGVLTGVQVEGEGGLTDDTGSTAQIVDLDEIIGVSGFLAGALKVGLSDNFDVHSFLLYRFGFVVYPASQQNCQ